MEGDLERFKNSSNSAGVKLVRGAAQSENPFKQSAP
jgi:hypothetical protein